MWRTIAGLTQQQLGEALGAELGREPYSKMYISKIEREEQPVTKRTVLIGLARALRVSVTDLTGQPYRPADRTDLDAYMLAEAVRIALEGPDEVPTPRPIDQLSFAAERSMGARMHCDLPGLGAHLPNLLIDTQTLFHDGDPRAGELLVQAAVTGSLALKPVGFVDLAIRLADLAIAVARQLDDPVCLAAAQFARAQCALAAGNRRRSYELAVGGLGGLEGLARPQRMQQLAWSGMLHLHAALTAASMHRVDDAHNHLGIADEVARHVEGNPWQMELSPANAKLWRVAVALENGEAGQVPELAQQVDVHALHTPQRRARLHLDLGRGLFLAGRLEEATRSLLAADYAAPGDLRHRPSAVEIVVQMVRSASAPGGGSDALRELAKRCGVTAGAVAEDA
jgi:transcriptional regulator with XRE-family HTH domain